MKKWKGLALVQRVAEADDEAVDKRLEQLAELHAQLIVEDDSTRLARGHFAMIDYDGTIAGEPFEKGTGKEVTVEIGSGKFL